SVVATPGVGQVTLKWKKAPAPSTVPVRAYVVTPYLNGLAQSPLSFDTSILQRIIGGLVGGGSYTFTVTAQNADGFGVASPLSAPVVPM
ncbi:MAG TPA: fibronectin type III domain-containing protein, partial [Acidimicrobiia bacterium]|nr:fibronectin type III domain-containing protein [Acidimicrobiia bacterium]